MSLNTTQPNRRRHWLLGLVVVIIALTAGAVYAVFTQTLPQVVVPGQPQLTQGCAPLVQEGSVNPVSGVLLFDCAGKPAFTLSNAPSTGTLATPTFIVTTNPSTITVSLDITTTGSCTGSLQQLVNNTGLPVQNGGYDYCLGYSGVPAAGGTIGPITIQWAIP